ARDPRRAAQRRHRQNSAHARSARAARIARRGACHRHPAGLRRLHRARDPEMGESGERLRCARRVRLWYFAAIPGGQKMKIATGLLLCALFTLTTGGAMAAEIRVLSAGAVEPGLRAAAAAFHKQSGHDVHITFNTAPEIRKRIAGGDAFDVVIAPPAALDEFAGAGKVTGDRVNLGRVGLGVAVRPGAAVPDISSGEALKRSVLAAESIVFNRASSGIYFENLLKKMEIYGEVQAKTTRYAD